MRMLSQSYLQYQKGNTATHSIQRRDAQYWTKTKKNALRCDLCNTRKFFFLWSMMWNLYDFWSILHLSIMIKFDLALVLSLSVSAFPCSFPCQPRIHLSRICSFMNCLWTFPEMQKSSMSAFIIIAYIMCWQNPIHFLLSFSWLWLAIVTDLWFHTDWTIARVCHLTAVLQFALRLFDGWLWCNANTLECV